LLLLGTRRSELLSARWRDFDFSAGTWKVATSKSGKENLLPLPEAAIAILRSLANFQTGEWVFPGAGKSGHLQEPRKA
jgi:integrase